LMPQKQMPYFPKAAVHGVLNTKASTWFLQIHQHGNKRRDGADFLEYWPRTINRRIIMYLEDIGRLRK